ncbi:MAG: hypothetical protein ACI9W2_002612 [Gammaproteobacteria bacterium]|jgi:hypothetical protein
MRVRDFAKTQGCRDFVIRYGETQNGLFLSGVKVSRAPSPTHRFR